MGNSSTKKNKDDVIQIKNLDNEPIKIHHPPKNHISQNKIIEEKKLNEDEDEYKQFERILDEIDSNININLNITSNTKAKLIKINREINNEFNFSNLIKDDFDNTKACILCCNLDESDQETLYKLEWNKDNINQEKECKNQMIELIKRNRIDILKLIKNN